MMVIRRIVKQENAIENQQVIIIILLPNIQNDN